jgi:hypothetical protein
MILDRIADLKALAERASSTAHASTEDAAVLQVREQVESGHALFRNLGIANVRPLGLLGSDERDAVRQAASKVRGALDTLANASDTELVAYASTTAERRGSLSAVLREASSLRANLLSAQGALLGRLGQDIWAEDDIIRLDVISQLSHNGSAEAAGRRALEVRARLITRAFDDVGLPLDQLEGLIEEATQAARAVERLRNEQVPDEVIAFWDAASSESGAELDLLTPEVQQWLETHDALRSFAVLRK